MDNFDERPLERAPQADDPAPSPPPSKTPIIIIAIAGLLLGGAGAWWWMRGDPAPAADAPPSSSTTDTVLADTSAPPRELPPLGQMDTFLRALLGTLSSHPDFVRWLASDDLIRQMALAIDRISRGQSPMPGVVLTRPAADFQVSRGARQVTVDPSSYRRYDRFATIVDSLDARGVVEAYRTVQPRLDEAYRALGRSESGVDRAVDVALQTLIDTPVPEDPVRLVPGRGATYAYADAQYERLQPVQKQLMRMGPENVRRIQARLREIQALIASR